MRRQLAIEAARLMAEEGIEDFFTAKRKAAQRLGAPDTRNMPANSEIEQALLEHQRLFRHDSQPAQLRELRRTSLQVMDLLKEFNPHLVGPVLRGTADIHSKINLHVFADSPEEVGWKLMELNIHYHTSERRPAVTRRGNEAYLVYHFTAGDTGIELTVYPVDGIRQAPPSPVDGKPMQRASPSAVIRLLEQ